jgi:hypothetical protein
MKKLLIHSALALSFAFTSQAFAAGSSPWLDRDLPSGYGEYETTKDHLKMTCRIKGTNAPVVTGNPVGYTCDTDPGAICKNANVAGGCKDVEVMYSWSSSRPGVMPPYPAGHTGWLDRDNPSGTGDWETTKDLLKIKCRFTAGHASITTGSPAGYTCAPLPGGVCKNGTPAGNKCKDMQVQYTW